MYIHTHIYMYMYTCISISMYMYIIYMCMYVYRYICIYSKEMGADSFSIYLKKRCTELKQTFILNFDSVRIHVGLATVLTC